MSVDNLISQSAHPREPENLLKSINDVVKGGYCVGCGGCASLAESGREMRLNEFGLYQPDVTDRALAEISDQASRTICPFLGEGPHEDELASRFGGPDAQPDRKLGWYRGLHAGYAASGNWRQNGSSGGLTSWILSELLSSGLVDGVIQVRENLTDRSRPGFEFCISRTQADLSASAKTRYYPIELSQVVKFVRETPGRYAFVGVPCFNKTLQRIARQDEIVGERLKFFVAIICGHLKSSRFGESLAWQLGVKPEEPKAINFRHKIPGRPANNYGFSATNELGETKVAPMSTLAGHDWGLGMFRLKACDYCDDVVGETADVSFGDAWLPQFSADSEGTNILIVRNPVIEKILQEGAESGALALEALSPADMVKSQDASYRHRRDGLAYRLYLDDRAKRLRPLKRVQPASNHIDFSQKMIFRFRSAVSRKSHLVYLLARQKNDISLYVDYVSKATKTNSRLKRFDRVFKRLKAKFARSG